MTDDESYAYALALGASAIAAADGDPVDGAALLFAAAASVLVEFFSSAEANAMIEIASRDARQVVAERLPGGETMQ